MIIKKVKINKRYPHLLFYPVIQMQRRKKASEVAAKRFYSTLSASAGLIPVALYAW